MNRSARVVIAGAHGKVGRLLAADLLARGHTAVGVIRDARQSGTLEDAGVVPVVLDLENTTVEDVADVLRGADAAVFTAGSGEHSPPSRSLTMDRDGAILFGEAAVVAGVRRFVLLSGAGADDYERGSAEPFQVYLRAKSDADAAVRTLDLDWVILRPDALHDGPAVHTYTVSERVDRVGIARADVAAALSDVAVGPDPGRVQLEITTGRLDFRDALARAARSETGSVRSEHNGSEGTA